MTQNSVVLGLSLVVLTLLIPLSECRNAFGISALEKIQPNQNILPNTTTFTITNGTTIMIPNQGNNTQNNNPSSSLSASPLQQLQR